MKTDLRHLRSLPALLTIFLLPAALQAAPISEQALSSLKRMSATLAAAKAFTYQTEIIMEVPAKNGQMLTLFANSAVALKRPDKLRARFTGEAPHFDFFYDGSSVAAYAPGNNVYSISKAPATIDTMLPALESETGIRIATRGLLMSDPYKALTLGLKSGSLVGKVNVGGIPCEHLAFRGDGVNWEIWIESEARALPRRLAATFTDRPGSPRVLIEFSHWNLRPSLRPGDFVFRAPAGSKEIPFLSIVRP